ncbi:MFS transporter [Flexithrix dorotheae]|uniref:MFS transporter n=1 Tax=Flexithrix dorotheae TaxID=70993 RepID=UPI0003752538|nr:MFS transporter [Flexithrix dorotheae]
MLITSHAIMPNETPRIYTLQFWLLCMSSFLFFGSFNMIIPELPSYLTSLGGEDYKGLIIGLFTIMAMFSRPFSGRLTDTIGRIPVMIYGVFICIICGFLYPVLTSVSGFLFLRLVHGMSTGFKPTATSAYIADIIPYQKRGEALGILGFCSSMGIASGPSLGGWMVLHYSINVLFYTSSLFALLSILVLVGMKETLENKQKFSGKLLLISPNEIIENRVIIPGIIVMISVFSFGTVLTIIPDLSDHLGIKNRGTFYTIFTISSLLVRILGGKASDKYGRTPVVKVALSFLVISMILLGFVEDFILFAISAIFFGVGVGLNTPSLFAWTIDLSLEDQRGKAMATAYISLELGIFLGSVISSLIFMNDPEMFKYTFWVTGGVTMLALVFLQIVTMKKLGIPPQEIKA